MEKHLKIEISGYMAWIMISRPEVRNALDATTLEELSQAIDICEQNEEVRVILIRGEGEKSFASGADIKQLQERKMLRALEPGMQGIYKKIEECKKATIAVINGYALGGGCELALACDIRIAADHAKIGLPELNLGILPGAGGTQRLARIIGKGRAIEMILTGKIVDGTEAERIGLISKSVPYERLGNEAIQLAESISSKGPIAVQLTKMAIHRGFDVDTETALLIEKMAQTIAFGTEDKNEGTTAFLEKRQAQFLNR